MSAQKVMIVQIPSEANAERLINERVTEANADGWHAVQMMDHNGFLVLLMESGGAQDIAPEVFEAIVESVRSRLQRARVKLWQVDDGYDVPTLLQPRKFDDVGEVDLHHLVLSVVESTLGGICTTGVGD